MHREGEEIHVDTEEARGGATPGVMRYVLGISLFLAIAALSALWITAALTADNPAAPYVTTSDAATTEN